MSESPADDEIEYGWPLPVEPGDPYGPRPDPPTGTPEAYAAASDRMFELDRLSREMFGGPEIAGQQEWPYTTEGKEYNPYDPPLPSYNSVAQSSSRAAISPSDWRASMEGVLRLIETDGIRSADPFRGRRPVNIIVMSDDGYSLLRNHLKKVTLAVPGSIDLQTMQGIPIHKSPTESTALMEALRLVYEQGLKVLLYVDSRREFVILDPHKLAAWNIYGFTRPQVLPRSTDAVHHNPADKLQQPVDGGGGSEEHQQDHPGSEAADGDVLRGPEAIE